MVQRECEGAREREREKQSDQRGWRSERERERISKREWGWRGERGRALPL